MNGNAFEEVKFVSSGERVVMNMRVGKESGQAILEVTSTIVFGNIGERDMKDWRTFGH